MRSFYLSLLSPQTVQYRLQQSKQPRALSISEEHWAEELADGGGKVKIAAQSNRCKFTCRTLKITLLCMPTVCQIEIVCGFLHKIKTSSSMIVEIETVKKVLWILIRSLKLEIFAILSHEKTKNCKWIDPTTTSYVPLCSSIVYKLIKIHLRASISTLTCTKYSFFLAVIPIPTELFK